MAGHNKWSKVKRPKGALDAKCGKLFSKLATEITLAAKTGGGSLNGNPRLRTAVRAVKAPSKPKRALSAPSDNFERPIECCVGESSVGAAIHEHHLKRTDCLTADEARREMLTSHDQLCVLGDSLKRAGLRPGCIKLTTLPESKVHVTNADVVAQFMRLSDALLRMTTVTASTRRPKSRKNF